MSYKSGSISWRPVFNLLGHCVKGGGAGQSYAQADQAEEPSTLGPALLGYSVQVCVSNIHRDKSSMHVMAVLPTVTCLREASPAKRL